AKAGRKASEPLEQQGRAFGPSGRHLGDAADLELRVRAIDAPQDAQRIHRADELAQIAIAHVAVPWSIFGEGGYRFFAENAIKSGSGARLATRSNRKIYSRFRRFGGLAPAPSGRSIMRSDRSNFSGLSSQLWRKLRAGNQQEPNKCLVE